MLFLPLLLYCCTTGVQSQDQLYQLNDDGYIECYEDLDCPLPIELPEENSFMQFTCTGLSRTFRLTFSETLIAFIAPKASAEGACILTEMEY